MKKIAFIFSLFVAVSAWGQTSGNPAFASPFANAQAVATLTNQFGTNIVPANIPPMLAALENNIAQILPFLAALNDGFNFSNPNGVISGTTGMNSGAAPVTANFGTSIATNLSQNLGANFGVNVATPTTAVAPSTPVPLIPNGTALPSAVAANPASLIPGFGGSVNATAGAATTGPRDTLRALLILQNDLQRLLPLLNAINAGTGTTTTPGQTNSLTGSIR